MPQTDWYYLTRTIFRFDQLDISSLDNVFADFATPFASETINLNHIYCCTYITDEPYQGGLVRNYFGACEIVSPAA